LPEKSFIEKDLEKNILWHFNEALHRGTRQEIFSP
jgi:hypothetical protein